ncbi:transcriptional regulator, TetR family [Ferrimonas balearica DSM 9799]|uniref:Transcriptional regulator, TetR family n=1 Tax=Ferrimonas balearica (strain DSM 9799 / CCM 4581 / KCTC 23876 / PAT) TaxID=550540 RepID=E1SRL3_FERBD|nr:TetR/AcrR family transcriptional regulator [Ferrimonas balearica]ADN76934.1 transcriptional regulator, TetR family [Ferrimonas balearica DSM 9799]
MNSQTRILRAFTQLLRDREYRQITIADLIDTAQVSRSTFYRHFSAKLGILTFLHQRRFATLLCELNSPEDWQRPEPPASLVAMFARFEGQRAMHRSFSDTLGADGEPALKQIEQALIRHLSERLELAFPGQVWAVPPRAIALSLAGLYQTHLSHWRQGQACGSAEAMAALVHRHSRALVWDALQPA